MSADPLEKHETLLDGTRRVRWTMQATAPGQEPYEIVIDVQPDGRTCVNNKPVKQIDEQIALKEKTKS